MSSVERVKEQLVSAGWDFARRTPPELLAEYDANPSWWMGIGWFLDREYVEVRLRPRATGGDPAGGRGLVWRAYPMGTDQGSVVEALIVSLVQLQDNLEESSWRRVPEVLSPLSDPLLFEVPGGFLVC